MTQIAMTPNEGDQTIAEAVGDEERVVFSMRFGFAVDRRKHHLPIYAFVHQILLKYCAMTVT